MLIFVNNYVVICSLCNIRGADCMKNPLALLPGAVLLGLLAHVEPSNGVYFYGGQIVRGLSVQIDDERHAEA